MAASSMSRRSFLKRVGVGGGAIAVVGGGGLAWRVVDQGVLAPGTGPAYEAWRAKLTGDGALSLVRAAILAANAHDTQPWRFALTADRIDLFADRSRTIGAVDPLGRELELSLGCALENLVLAAPPNGYAASVEVLTDRANPDHVARVELAPGTAPISALFEAIPRRHTDRGAYDTTKSDEGGVLEELSAQADGDSLR
jgi:hypothetical protein